MKKVLQTIFSVKNKQRHKVLCIFGIKFKFKRKEIDKMENSENTCMCKHGRYNKDVLSVAKNVGVGLKVNSPSIVTPNTVLGEYVNFNGMTISGGGMCKIGNYFHSGSNCKILTENHNYTKGAEIPYDSTYIYKDVIIEDFVWLGIDVIILPGAIIREGAIIQAGSVVHGEIPRCAIAGGNPAKVFAYRDINHFDKLKKEKKFH